MDFTGDGIGDLLTGSWPGELYLFRGEGKGKFAAGETLKDKNGKAINTGNASTVFAHDWNGDGKLDLLVGCIEGHIFFIPNEGSSTEHAFGKPQKLQAEGRDIGAGHGDSHAVVADWNGDGKADLVVGCGDGSVTWFRNVGSKSEPRLEPARTLLKAPPQMQPGQKASGPVRGTRAKVCVCDFNGDGILDLLVGDFSMSYGEAPKLGEKEEAEKQEALKERAKAMEAMQPYFTAIQKLPRPNPGSTAEQRAAYQKQVEELAEKYKKELEAYSAAFAKTRKFEAPYQMDGFVWLLAGQKPQSGG